MSTFVSNEQLIAIQKTQIESLEKQLAECIESHNYRQHLIDNLYKQLADIKYLSREEVEEIFDEELPDAWDYNEEKRFTMQDQYNIISAICKLALPEDDFLDKLNDYIKTNPDKIINQIMANVGVNNYKKNIIKILHEFVKYQIEADNLINNEAVEYVADEIITALEGK